MKNLIVCCFSLLLAAATAAQSKSPSVAPLAMPDNAALQAKGCKKNTETLPAGAVVFLENIERVNSETATVGQIVKFRVRMDVRANGKVLIATGALAIGRVKAVGKGSYNDPAYLTLEVRHVQTVDGQTVALAGDEQQYPGRYPNEGMIVEQGQSITARVMNNTEVAH